MSEEILKALMELFAILLKQEQVVAKHHIDYVRNFLNQQLSEEQVNFYFHFFEEKADLIPVQGATEIKKEEKKLTSVRDSVKILGICKKINKTLVQEQKLIVLVRLFELVNIDHSTNQQSMNILDTVAEVFKVAAEEFKSIQDFILNEDVDAINDPNIMVIDNRQETVTNTKKHFYSENLDSPIMILRITSIDLYVLRNCGNDNMFLNGLLVNHHRIYILAKGSSIKLAKSKPIFYSDIAARYMSELHASRFSFAVEHLEYKFPNGNLGIRDVSFIETQGKLVGIMGASGAGKTTLLNVMCGLEQPSKGRVLINDYNVHTQKEQVQSFIGYIPQDDLLIEELTVFENLFFNAKFCFKDKTDIELEELVNKTLASLGLLETKGLKVGSPLNKTISGGQRKRLNIALELIREPSILYVDEPTSGLSSRDSENVMDLLRELTLKGKLVIVVIHQPSSEIYKMFDKMVILDTGGYMIYYGNPVEAVIYFKKIDNQINSESGECATCGNVNPELIFNIIEAKIVDEYGNYTTSRKVPPTKWEEFYKTNVKQDTINLIEEKLKKILNVPSWLKQFKIYFTRDLLSKISNTQYMVLNMLEAPILGFILSYIIRYIVDPKSKIYIFRENDNIPIFVFMSLIVALFLGLMVSAEEIFRDRKILKREAFLNLSRSSYLISKVAILFIISAIQTFFFVIIANSILGLHGMYFPFWFALFTTASFANMLGLNISTSFNSAVTIYIVIPLLMIPMMVLSGAMFSFEKLNRAVNTVGRTPLMADLMPTKWAYEAMVVHQFKDNEYAKIFFPIEKKENEADFAQVYFLPELEKKLENCYKEFNKNGKIESTKIDLTVLKNELSDQFILVGDKEFVPTNLTAALFNEEIYSASKNYLKKLQNYYSYIFMQADKMKEDTINFFMKHDAVAFKKLKDDYYNESVGDIATKAFEKNKILEYNDRLIKNVDPVYTDPNPSNPLDFRSHFMAPTKKFMHRQFDTFWFNMIIVWIYTLVLFITLYFEAFKNLMIFAGKLGQGWTLFAKLKGKKKNEML